jgi:spore coat polysaccharide biosynthesis protein SpsF
LSRFILAIEKFQPENILRVTADCPLVDPQLIDDLWDLFNNNKMQYCSISTGAGVARSNVKRFPDGLDSEWVKAQVIRDISKHDLSKTDLEHVTSYIWRNRQDFRSGLLEPSQDSGNLRITLDTKSDLDFLLKLYEILGVRFRMANSTELIETITKFLLIEQAKIPPETYNEFYE